MTGLLAFLPFVWANTNFLESSIFVHGLFTGEKPEVKKTSNRETTLHGLQSFTNYSIRMLAYTVGGEGVLSDPLYCLTEEDSKSDLCSAL